jgi:DNA-directed RNA polymerase subunit RPC12/RpoP
MSTCSKADQVQISAKSSPQSDGSLTTSSTAESWDGSTSPTSTLWSSSEETYRECENIPPEYFPDTTHSLDNILSLSAWNTADAVVHEIYPPDYGIDFQLMGIQDPEEKTSKGQSFMSIADGKNIPRSVSSAHSHITLPDTISTPSLATPWTMRDGHDSETTSYDCPQCPGSFQRAFELEEHAKMTRHKPFACRQCKQSFSRRDARTRHRQLHQAEGSHPCPHCDKYRGRYAFKRKDHLKKHLLKVHRDADHPRLCPFSSCKLSSPYGFFKHFERRKDYTKHMREDHGDHV